MISKTFCSQICAAICKMISAEKILRAICIFQILRSARESADAICNFLFLHLAFCIFLRIDAAIICNLQNINFAFFVFKDDFYWAVSIRAVNRGGYFCERAPAFKGPHRAPGRFSRAHRNFGRIFAAENRTRAGKIRSNLIQSKNSRE